MGWLADKYDRRLVLIWLCIGTLVACLAMALAQGSFAVFLAAGAFGFATMPVYSISAAHAHDFADPTERVELSAALLFLYAVGAMASPLLAAVLLEDFGAPGMFGYIAAANLALVVFGLVRMRIRPAPSTRTRYTYIPRTSYLIGRLLGRGKDDS